MTFISISFTATAEGYLSKYEGAAWGIKNLPDEHMPLIQKALDVYASNELIDGREQKTGSVIWNKSALVSLRDYAREKGRNIWKS